MNIAYVRTRDEFVQLARNLGMRPDWHEPDEQNVTATVRGKPLDFDNAHGPRLDADAELHLILSERVVEEGRPCAGKVLAVANLADLCAWASEPHPEVKPCPPAASYDADGKPGMTELFPVPLGGAPVLLGFNGLALTATAGRDAHGLQLSARVTCMQTAALVSIVTVRWHCDGPLESRTGAQTIALVPRGGPGIMSYWSWLQPCEYTTRKRRVRKSGVVPITMQLSRAVFAAKLAV